MSTLELQGYTITAQLYASAHISIYRGYRLEDNLPVVIKCLQSQYPNPKQIAQLHHEYTIASHLNIAGIIKPYSLLKQENQWFIIAEDIKGDSLKDILAVQRLDLATFLHIAIQLSDTLGEIHSRHIIHKDIKPGNIIVNLATNQVKITDFSISTQLSSENLTVSNLKALEGTLAYLSPEQTGRMNRALDYRTDFYSLGIVFYEMLVGHVPFTMTDSMEIVHCHLAKIPPSPHILNPSIPHVISHLIMKLLAKMPESRYQSAYGIKYDLMACLRQLQETGKIEEFTCGEFDFSDRFQIPHRLYGRDAEIADLLQVFQQVSQGSTELMLVAGYSGIGKSALVQAVHTTIAQQSGYFISGKFDQLQRNIPYSAVVAAFTNLVQQLLTEDETQLIEWKNKLLTAVGSNGQVIIEVIPEVELLIGKQPSVSVLGAVEAQNRFNLVFQNFVQVFCQVNHPLIIFLDDLQWADSASLKLIPLMMANIPFLLLIGAYRDNEVTPTHPLMLTLADIHKNGDNFKVLTLNPLTLPDISQLVSETLQTDKKVVLPLAELLLEKTAGNPFFMGAFFKTLYTEQLIKFDIQHKVWQWDVAKIKAQNMTDNVIELMSAKVQKLSHKTQHLLKLAACIGNQFSLKTLAQIATQAESEVTADLWQAAIEGLIFPVGNSYKFVHDRIQQATYALIPELDKPALHRRIGQLLLKSTLSLEERLFEIVDHLNIGIALLTEQTERYALARLNLQAGKKAKQSAAYMATLKYLEIAFACLTTDSWQSEYALTVEIYQSYAEAEFLNSHFDHAAELVKLLEDNVKTNLEKAEALLLLVIQQTIQAHYAESITTARKALRLLDFNLPTADTVELALQQAFADVKTYLGAREISSLIQYPENQNLICRLAIQLYIRLDPPTYILGDLNLYMYVSVKVVALSLQYGNVAESAKGYANYGLIIGSGLGEFQSGYQFGMLAVAISKQFRSLAYECQADLLLGSWIHSWSNPIHGAKRYNLEGYHAGMDSGEMQFAMYNVFGYITNSWVEGSSLAEIQNAIIEYLPVINKAKNDLTTDMVLGIQLATLSLMAQPETVIRYGETLTESAYCQYCFASPLGYVTYCIVRAHSLYLLGQVEQALELLESSQSLLGSIFGFTASLDYGFCHSLVLLALFVQATEAQQATYLQTITAHQTQLKKWAVSCPENFLHKWYLIEAELANVHGRSIEAMDLYDKAIQLADKYGFIQQAALANELAGKFWLQRGKERFVYVYLTEAHYCYQNWGAVAKVKQLEQQYPYLLAQPSMTQSLTMTQTAHRHLTSTMTQSLSHTVGSSSTLDLATLMKASQAISSERVFEQLMQKLMRIVIENVGAEQGYLILEKSGQGLFVEVYGTTEQVQLLDSIPLTTVSLDKYALSSAIVMYAVRTQSAVVLNHATQEGLFTRDEYVLKRQPKSILCTPILHKNQLIGLLYLENNLTIGAFNPNRLLTVNLLSSQIAISLENVRFYQQLEQAQQEIQQHVDTLEIKVIERTTELAQANQSITLLNKRLKAENVRMGAELDIARQLQLMVLPKDGELTQITDLEIAAFMEPAAEVGGDYYDVLQYEGRVKVAIGDVTGHGLESGILMLMTQTAIRTLLTSRITEAKDFLTFLNRTLYNNIKRMNSDKNLTLCLLDYQAGQVRITGQHEEVLLVRKNGKVERIDTFDLGFSIGIEENIDMFINQLEIQLNQGDGIVLYTDGITEARNATKKQYGIKRLCEVISRHWDSSVQAIQHAVLTDLRQHIGSQVVIDDITLIVLKQK